MDPEYKGLILKEFNAYDRARAEIIRRGTKYENREAPVNESLDSEDDDDENENMNLSAAQRLKLRQMSQVNRQNVASRNDGISATEAELVCFEQMQVGPDTQLLNFWKQNEPAYPILSKIAREIYSIPASSASSEREFSIGTLVSGLKKIS